jgi:hypothetical protein
MGAELGGVGGHVAVGSAAQERQRDRWFFTGMAVAALLTVFTGFAPSYYLGSFVEAPPRSTLVHVHAGLSTSWILLFLTQTSLIAARRADLHQPLCLALGGTGAWRSFAEWVIR